MSIRDRKDTKICDRCGAKLLFHQKKCDECGLVFSRLEKATNAEAKKQFFRKDKSIIMVKNLPTDVNKWILLTYCLLAGVFGAHNFYVGRYYRASYMLVFGLLSLVYVSFSFPPDWYYNFMTSAPIIISVAILSILWLSDFVLIVFDRFKVPVAIGSDKWKQLLLE